jgi:hypothetical protein
MDLFGTAEGLKLRVCAERREHACLSDSVTG